MIHGIVDSRFRPIIPIEIAIKGGQFRKINALLDTGFDGDIALPNQHYRLLRSSPLRAHPTKLPGGSYADFHRCLTLVNFGGEIQRAIALDIGAEDEPIAFIGTGLLRGYNISINVKPGGKVSITPTS